MESLNSLADNFLTPYSQRGRWLWYVISGLVLFLMVIISALYFFFLLEADKPPPYKIYYHPYLKVRLSYPAAWLPVPSARDSDGLPRRFAGQDGWFEVSATSGAGVILTDIAAGLNSATTLPFGVNPKLVTTQIAGQPGIIIVPTQSGVEQAAAVVAYPEPVLIGSVNYRFFIIKFDLNHLHRLLSSLKFIKNDLADTADLPQIIVYTPPPQVIVNSPFEVAGVSKTINKETIDVNVINNKKQIIWHSSTSIHKLEGANWGSFRATVDLSGAEVNKGEVIELQVGRGDEGVGEKKMEIVLRLSLQLGDIQPTRVVAVYFGSIHSPSGEECSRVYALERHVPAGDNLVKLALEELLKGPSLPERQEGYFTSLPPEVIINDLIIQDGVARVDFNDNLERGVGGSCRVLAIRTQIEKTLKQFPSIKEVKISINGRTEDILQP